MMASFKKVKKSDMNQIANIGLKQTEKLTKTPIRILEL